MPHIIAEYSSDLSEEKIINAQKEIQNFMSQIEGANFASEACKIRGNSFNKYHNGLIDESGSSFIHLTIKILEGRSNEIKEILAKGAAKILQEFVSQNQQKQRFDISVDIADMDRAFYQKERF